MIATKRRAIAGVTVTETAFGLLVLAIGVIGVASLHMERIRPGTGGALRIRAAELANSMANTIRTSPKQVTFENAIGVVCKPGYLGKSAEVTAANRVACWEDQVEQDLPNGMGSISIDRTTVPGAYMLTVTWSEPGLGTASYVLRVEGAPEQVTHPVSKASGVTVPMKPTPTPNANSPSASAAREAN